MFAGSQIAMDNAMRMRMVHGQGQSFDERAAARLRGRQRPIGQAVGKIASFHQLHRDVRKPVLLADVEDADNTSDGVPLPPPWPQCETALARWDRRPAPADLLERDKPSQLLSAAGL